MNSKARVTLTRIVHSSAASLNPIQRAWAITKPHLWYSGSQQYCVFSNCLPAMQIMTVWYVTLPPVRFYRFPYTIWIDNKRFFPLPRPQVQTTANLGQTTLFAYIYYHTGWSHWCPRDWKLASHSTPVGSQIARQVLTSGAALSCMALVLLALVRMLELMQIWSHLPIKYSWTHSIYESLDNRVWK